MDSVRSGVSYEDCSVYVDAADSSTVMAQVRDLLGSGGEGSGLVVGPVRVVGAHNDYVTGRKTHRFDFLEWPTVLECEAPTGAQPGAVVAAVTTVLECLWSVGCKAVAACDFEDELPAGGGIARYPVPAVPADSPSRGRAWWKSPFPASKKEKREST
ncbi:hypothetical protein [Streptomyces sp. NPDC002133]|uniref:hypothetical protein n=1 Tax=Streptomyces sp. NPDC002133 TaxID=3154409 RepID=UPI0033293363